MVRYPSYEVSSTPTTGAEGEGYSAKVTEANGQLYIAPMLYIIIDAANAHVHRHAGRPRDYHQLPPLGQIHKTLGWHNGRPC